MDNPGSVQLLSNRTYNIFRHSAMIVLPAVGALYFTLAQIWGLPKAEEVAGTVAALNLFVGSVAAVAQRVYNKTGAKYDGSIDITTTDDGKKLFDLKLNSDPDNLHLKDEITFKVGKPASV